MTTHVRFLKPFIYADTPDAASYSFNANPQVEGYLDDDVADYLIGEGLAEEIV